MPDKLQCTNVIYKAIYSCVIVRVLLPAFPTKLAGPIASALSKYTQALETHIHELLFVLANEMPKAEELYTK